MQRYFAKDKIDNNIINVMRMNSNDKIECIYNKKLYICRVGDININSFEIIEELDDNNELPIEITIAVSLVKEQKMDLILQKLTELGVSRIIPLKTERSIIKIDDKRFKKKKDRWISICKEASEQSKRNIIPEITDIKTIKELNDYEYDLKLFGSVSNKDNLVNKYLQKNNKYAKIIFVIGSEGGLSPKEEELLTSMNYIPTSLGNRVLRVETATFYIASILNYSSMR